MRTRLLAPLALVVLLTSPSGAAQPDLPGKPAAADKPAATLADKAAEADKPAAVEKAPASPAKDNSHDTLTVDFPDEDVRSILRNVADLFELNIIMPDSLQGKTTIKLREVTWRQIFDNVLKPVNYTFIEEGNIIKIVSNESLLQEPASTEVFMFNYAKAAEIMPTLTSLVDAASGGKIVLATGSNSLVITERPSRMNRIRAIIEKLDRATDQVMIESKFVEVTDSDVKNIGVNWSSLANYQVGAGKINQTFSRNRDSRASADNKNQVIDDRLGTTGYTNLAQNNVTTTTINGTNGATTGVQTTGSSSTGTVTSTNGVPTSTSTTGTNGSLANTNTTGTTNSVTNNTTVGNLGTVQNDRLDRSNDILNSLYNIVDSGGTNRTLSAVFSASDFNVVLSALQSLQDTKVVSNPTIVTLNNSLATINVGEERPIPSYTYSQERGTYEVSGFTYRPIGIILKVTPQVNSQGFIRLTVEPEVSQSTRDASFNGAAIPIVETRKASTTVSLRDGYTMGIGGLVRSAAKDSDTKVPVLGDLPLLGRLFKHKGRNHETTNLIIFITAKTISAEGAPIEQVFESERVRQLKMRREELPGYRDGSNPFLETPPKDAKAAGKPEAKR